MTTPPAARPTSRSASFIGSLNLVGRLLERAGAFGQILLIAAVLGATTSADLYFIASIAPLMIGAIGGEALYATALPSLSRRSDDDVIDLMRAGFWLSLALLAMLTAAYVAVALVVVQVAEPAGSDRPWVWLAFAPLAILLGLGAYLSAVLLRVERYVWPSFRSAAATLVGLALTAVALSLSDDVLWVAVGVTTGYAVALALLVAEVASAAGAGVFAPPSRAALRELAERRRTLVVAAAGGVLGGQAFVFVERALAASLGVGAVSAISYGRGVAFSPNVVAQSISHGLYPGMLRAHAARDRPYLRGTFIGGLRITLFVALATATFVAAFADAIVPLLFDRGSISPTWLHEIERSLIAFSLAIVGMMLTTFTAQLFRAVDRFRAVVAIQAFALALYVPLAYVLRPELGPAGLALAFGIAEVAGGLVGMAVAARGIGVGLVDVVRKVLAPAGGRAAVFAAVLLGFDAALDGAPALVGVVGGLAAATITALALLWFSGWSEVDVLRRVARRVRGRAAG